MGNVQQQAGGGGGKVTTENLTAENIKNGVTVTVKQGSKTVQSVTGTAGKKILVGSFAGAMSTTQNVITLSATSIPGWQDLTTERFAAVITGVGSMFGNTLNTWMYLTMPTLSYNSENGTLTVSNMNKMFWQDDAIRTLIYIRGNIYCYV